MGKTMLYTSTACRFNTSLYWLDNFILTNYFYLDKLVTLFITSFMPCTFYFHFTNYPVILLYLLNMYT